MVFSGILAFSAGLVVAFNPCGAALLPSYLVYLLSAPGFAKSRQGWFVGLQSGLLISGGFALLFALAGWALYQFGHIVFLIAPIASLAMAVMLMILAWYLWSGHLPASGTLGIFSRRIEKIAKRGSPLSFLTYGMSYGLASLTCSLPVFLAVMAQGLSQGRFVGINFLWFTFGMTVVVTTLSIMATTFNSLVNRFIQDAMPHIQKLSAGVMVLASGYLFWYWIAGPGFHTILG